MSFSMISNPRFSFGEYLNFHATQNGAGVVHDASGDYAASEVYWEIRPPSQTRYYIYRVIVTLEDVGSFDTDSYGNGITLTNGIDFEVVEGTGADAVQIIDLFPEHNVKKNGDWAHFCYDVSENSWGQGNPYLAIRWTFAKGGTAIVLDGSKDQALRLTLNDNFSGLEGHFFVFQGHTSKVQWVNGG